MAEEAKKQEGEEEHKEGAPEGDAGEVDSAKAAKKKKMMMIGVVFSGVVV